MSPKLFGAYPHREEDRGIDLAPLFLWLVLLKLLCNQLKIFVNLTFSQKVWPFVLFWFTSCAELRVLWVQQNRSDILVLLWQKCQIFKVFYLWLKKFDTKINAILVISELMASAGKVLRCFCCHGEKFTQGGMSGFDHTECEFPDIRTLNRRISDPMLIQFFSASIMMFFFL